MNWDLQSRGTRRLGLVAAMLVTVAISATAGIAQTAADNPYSDQLSRMSPEERASKLASFLGLWCIGTKPFYMGLTKQGRAKGYAYWSITCAGAQSYMIQLSPDGAGAALDCRQLKAGGQGRECYKTF
jgi:hypothetical protein